MKKNKVIFLTLFVILITIMMLWVKENPLLTINLFNRSQYDSILNYQITTLPLAGLVLGLVALFTKGKALAFLNMQKRDGVITPEPWIGIKPKENESWKSLGRNFALIITIVTSVVVYFQVLNQSMPRVDLFMIWLAVGFALINSFVEEIVFRFSFVGVGTYENAKPLLIQGLSAAIFGLAHYFGTPSGFPGVLMAGFIGWFLSKSMIETKGFFWAWLIHFLQDVVIYLALFMSTK